MKKTKQIAQWLFAVLFALCMIGNGLHYSSAFLGLAAVMMLPIPAIQNIYKKVNIKKWLSVLLAVIVFVVGIALSPKSTDIPSDPIGGTTISDTQNGVSSTTENNSSSEQSKTPDSSTAENTSSNSPTNNGGVGVNEAKPVELANIPAYSGSPYVVINDNQPTFSADELSTVGYESYSDLDGLGRCGVAIAACGTEIMPTGERGSISSIKPTGWIQAKYDCVSGKYLYNRCHLIGWQLSGENANRKNLITGTKYLNVEGMLPFENMVADYINETGNHVAYRITPIFKGNNLVCSGVQMEAYSVEDNGDGICFNVYCYNVQPGVVINYATGSSYLENSSGTTTSIPNQGITETPENNSSTDNVSATYILNKNSKKIHYPGCHSADRIADKNRQVYNGSIDDLFSQGYTTCGNCF